jgi:predicted nuclease with RNAse H fold
MDVYLGADPGGVKKTGVAVFSPPNTLVSKNVSSVQEALNWYISQIKTDKAIAIGIDAPLSWSIEQSGWRKQDLYIRSRYSKYSSSVQCTNSLHGSCAVQGPLLAIEIKKQFKSIEITETHPKVTREILKSHSSIALPNLRFNRNDHRRDAELSAWIAYCGFNKHQGWDNLNKAPNTNGQHLPVGPISYFFPS